MYKKRFIFFLIAVLFLTVLQSGSADAHSADEITLTVTPGKVQVGEVITLAVQAPGAEKIEIYAYDKNNGNSKHLYQSIDGDSWSQRYAYGSSVHLSLTARACFDGVWTEETAPVSMDWTSNGKLSAVNANVPASIPEGQMLSVSFDPVENAEYYLYRFCLASESCNTSYRLDSNTNQFAADVSGEEPGSYKLVIEARGTGWESSYATYTFEITESGLVRPEAPTVSIDSSVTEFPINKSIRFYITSPQPEKIRYIFSGASNESSVTDAYSGNYDGSSYTFWYGTSTAGEHTLKFSVMIDGVWSDYSEPVTFTAVSYGELETPTVSIPAQINAGEDLPVTITVGENVTRYSIQIYAENGEYLSGISVTPRGETSILKNIPMSGYGEGTYRLSVYASADGYKSARFEKTFSITGTPAPAPEVTQDKTSITRAESIKFTVNAEGAEKIRYQFYAGGTPVEVSAAGDQTVIELAGTYPLSSYSQIRFSVYANETWSAWTDWFQYTVTAAAQLAAPTLRGEPTEIYAGEQFILYIDPVTNANRFRVQMFPLQDGHINNESSAFYNIYDDANSEGLEVTLDSNMAPGSYRIQVYALNKENIYNESNFGFIDVEILENDDIPVPTLTTNKSEIYVNDSYSYYELTAAADEGETIEFSFAHSDENYTARSEVMLENGMAGYRGWESYPGTVTVKARVKVSGKWSRYSDPVSITVLSKGKLERPSTNIPDVVTALTDTSFTVTSQSETDYTSAYLYYLGDDPNGRTISSKYLSPNVYGGNVYTISAIDLPAGYYRLYVSACAEKWETSDEYSKTFKAEGAAVKPSFTLTASSSEVLTASPVTFTVTGENIISDISVYVYDNGSWLGTVSLSKSNPSGSFTYSKWITSGEHELYAKYDSYESEKINVSVKSNGKLETPSIEMKQVQSTVSQNERLYFTINPVEHADGYFVFISSEKGPTYYPIQRDYPYSGSDPYETSIEWNRQGFYEISCLAYGAGYDASETSAIVQFESLDYALHALDLDTVVLYVPDVLPSNINFGIVGNSDSYASPESPLVIPLHTTKEFWLEEDPIELPKGSSRTIYWILEDRDDPNKRELIGQENFVLGNQLMSHTFEKMGDFKMYWIATVDDVAVSRTRDWYITVTAPDTLPGDMDGNGKVNTMDVVLLRDYFLKRGIGVVIVGNPDVDLSGSVNAMDVLLLRDFYLKRGVGVIIY